MKLFTSFYRSQRESGGVRDERGSKVEGLGRDGRQEVMLQLHGIAMLARRHDQRYKVQGTSNNPKLTPGREYFNTGRYPGRQAGWG